MDDLTLAADMWSITLMLFYGLAPYSGIALGWAIGVVHLGLWQRLNRWSNGPGDELAKLLSRLSPSDTAIIGRAMESAFLHGTTMGPQRKQQKGLGER
jgi:hypothetical protein